jgi:hypothetical protein
VSPSPSPSLSTSLEVLATFSHPRPVIISASPLLHGVMHLIPSDSIFLARRFPSALRPSLRASKAPWRCLWWKRASRWRWGTRPSSVFHCANFVLPLQRSLTIVTHVCLYSDACPSRLDCFVSSNYAQFQSICMSILAQVFLVILPSKATIEFGCEFGLRRPPSPTEAAIPCLHPPSPLWPLATLASCSPSLTRTP